MWKEIQLTHKKNPVESLYHVYSPVTSVTQDSPSPRQNELSLLFDFKY